MRRLRIRNPLKALRRNPDGQLGLLLGLVAIGAGAYFVTRKKPKKAAEDIPTLTPSPGPLPEPPEPEPDPSELPSLEGFGKIQVFPAGATDYPIPTDPTDVAVTEDCTVLTVPVAWWDTTAIAIFNSQWNEGRRDAVEIVDMIANTEIGMCVGYDTPGVNGFLAALAAWVVQRIDERVVPTTLQQ